MKPGFPCSPGGSVAIMGISEKEVLAFTDARADVDIEEDPEPDYSVFVKPYPDMESIDSNLDYARRLDSLLNQR